MVKIPQNIVTEPLACLTSWDLWGRGGGVVMELSADDSINTWNGTMNLIITEKHDRRVQMTESLCELQNCKG